MKLENKHGVRIDTKDCGHWSSSNATCSCGCNLLVAAPIFEADHKAEDPVMVCLEYGHNSYRFSELKLGRQEDGS